jgi:biopolymer transport protein ExbD
MAMHLRAATSEPDVMVEINTTPLIDVMLVLLIMLIVTIPIQLHAVNLNMPSGTPPPAAPQIVTIDIDFDGTVLWNGEMLPDRQALEAHLAKAAALPEQPEVHIKPNKLVQYKAVAGVLASAQRLGVTKLGIVGQEQFAK